MDFKTQVARPRRPRRAWQPMRCWCWWRGEALPAGLDAAARPTCWPPRSSDGDFALKAGPGALRCTASPASRRRAWCSPPPATVASRRCARRVAAGLAQLKARRQQASGRGARRRCRRSTPRMPKRWSAPSAMRSTCTATPSPARRTASKLAKRDAGVQPRPKPPALHAGLARGEAIAAGVALARECANRPATTARPTYLAEQAQGARQAHRPEGRGAGPQGCREARHGLASCRWPRARTSRRRFIVAALRRRAPRREAPVVLVGKGITFDTGGISHQARRPRWTR